MRSLLTNNNIYFKISICITLIIILILTTNQFLQNTHSEILDKKKANRVLLIYWTRKRLVQHAISVMLHKSQTL